MAAKHVRAWDARQRGGLVGAMGKSGVAGDLRPDMAPAAFCRNVLHELAFQSANEAWVRGASPLCETCGATDAQRFEFVLEQLMYGAAGSALSQSATWLLARWQSAHAAPAPTS